MKKNLFIKTNTVKNTLWSPSVKAFSSIILTNETNRPSSKETPKVKEHQIKLSRKSTKVDSFESSSLSRISVKSSPILKKSEMKNHKRILSLNNDLSLKNSELHMSIRENKNVSHTKNKSIFYNAINKKTNSHYSSNSSLLNKNTTNRSGAHFNSANTKTKNIQNKKTPSLSQYRHRSKVSRNINNTNNKNVSGNVIITNKTNIKHNNSSNNDTKQDSPSSNRANKIKFIQLFWKNNYFKNTVIPSVNLIIKHFRLHKESKVRLNHNNNQQNKQNESSHMHLKMNNCAHGIKTFPRLKTDVGNLRYQIQSYMIHKEKAKIKSILINRDIQITKENNLLFTMDNINHIECDNINHITNKKQLIFNKEHPFIKHRQMNSITTFYPIKLVPLIPKNTTWQFQTKKIITKENTIKKKFLHKEIIQNNCIIIYIVCVIKSHLWNSVLFKVLEYIDASSSCNSKQNKVDSLLNKYLNRKKKIQEVHSTKSILCEQEL